jgi:hypothetical protein
MAGRRSDQNRNSGFGNRTLENPEEEQDPEALSDVDEEEDEAELEGLADPPVPGLDELGLDPAAPRIPKHSQTSTRRRTKQSLKGSLIHLSPVLMSLV